MKRVLEPIERVSEVLFGLIMVLTFTGSFSAAESGQAEVRAMLVGALGCNLAWGFIDAIMYLMACLGESAAPRRLALAIRQAGSEDEAKAIIQRGLPSTLVTVMKPADIDRLYADLSSRVDLPKPGGLTASDLLGGLAVFLLVFLSTFPITIPFLMSDDIQFALRTSNAIAVAMMLVTGYAFGRLAGYRPWLTGLVMVVIGCILVAITIALGG